MKTLHTAYRVLDIARSVAFYGHIGFREIGRVALGGGATLVMLNLPGDNDEVSLELVYDPALETITVGNGFSHIVVQVDRLDATRAQLAEKGVACAAPERPGGPHGPYTCFLWDPDGYRIELVQWPPGHPDGMTRADFQ